MQNTQKLLIFSSEKEKSLNISDDLNRYNIKKEVKIMGKVIIKFAVKRKPGYLYYIDGQGHVCEAKMSRGGRKKKKKR